MAVLDVFLNVLSLYLIGATGAAAVAYSVLDRVNLPGIKDSPEVTSSQKSIDQLTKELEGDAKTKGDDKAKGYYKKWQDALDELGNIEKEYNDAAKHVSPSDEKADQPTGKLDDIKKALGQKDLALAGKLTSELSKEIEDQKKVTESTKQEKDPVERLQSIQERFRMKMEEIKILQWEIEKLESARAKNYADIDEEVDEMRRWAVPLYIIVGGGIAVIYIYVSSQQVVVNQSSVLTALAAGGAWTVVAKYLKKLTEQKVQLPQGT